MSHIRVQKMDQSRGYEASCILKIISSDPMISWTSSSGGCECYANQAVRVAFAKMVNKCGARCRKKLQSPTITAKEEECDMVDGLGHHVKQVYDESLVVNIVTVKEESTKELKPTIASNPLDDIVFKKPLVPKVKPLSLKREHDEICPFLQPLPKITVIEAKPMLQNVHFSKLNKDITKTTDGKIFPRLKVPNLARFKMSEEELARRESSYDKIVTSPPLEHLYAIKGLTLANYFEQACEQYALVNGFDSEKYINWFAFDPFKSMKVFKYERNEDRIMSNKLSADKTKSKTKRVHEAYSNLLMAKLDFLGAILSRNDGIVPKTFSPIFVLPKIAGNSMCRI